MECARRCSVENVEKIAITHSQMPAVRASEGQRYMRQRRRRNTSGPTIASARTTSPKKRNPAANSQWAVSARGSILTLGGLEVVHDARRDDEREDEPDEHDEQRRLDGPVPEALPLGVEERDAVRLRERPDDPAEHGQRAERLHGKDAESATRGARADRSFCARGDELVHDRSASADQSGTPVSPCANG